MNESVDKNLIVQNYLQYLELECGLSVNSLAAYRRDIVEFIRLFKIKDDFEISSKIINEYLTKLHNLNRKPGCINLLSWTIQICKSNSLASGFTYMKTIVQIKARE